MDNCELRNPPQSTNRGQSLVETAVFLPIIFLLLAGVLEISNLLITQNRVQTAARVGTGFGATNYDETLPITDTFNAMSLVALNNVTETLDLDEARWDIYTVKATVNAAGDGFTEWIWGHPHGTEQVFAESDWTANEPQIQSDILDALDSSANGLEIVATVSYHNRTSFLGLNFFNPGLTRIRGLTVMRVSETQGSYGGCDTFPIALSVENYAVHPYDADDPDGELLPAGHEMYRFVEGINYGGNGYWWPYHATSGSDMAVPPPYYTIDDTSRFPANTPGTHIEDAEPGDIFLVKQASTENDGIAGAFGWLRWDEDSNANNQGTLADSLLWPGNSTTYDYTPWSDDGIINKYDLVKVSTGTINSNEVRAWMREHVDEGLEGRQLRIIVFTPPLPGYYNNGDFNHDMYGTQLEASGGQAVDYEVYAFVRVRIVAWKLTGQDNWVLMEFIAWDEECTVPPAAYP